MPVRVQMPNGTVRPFREGTPKSVIRRAQADMLADMRNSSRYDGFDFSAFDVKPRNVTVTQTAPDDDQVKLPVTAPQGGHPAAGENPALDVQRLSAQGDQFLKKAEGNSLNLTERQKAATNYDRTTGIYTDATGNATFGYGHKIEVADLNAMRQKLSGMTPEQQQAYADQLYAADVDTHYNGARNQVGAEIFDALPQNQKDALVIDRFNSGKTGPLMTHAIQRGDAMAAGNQFDSWNGIVNGVKQKIPGLVKRQLNTRDIWLNGDYSGKRDVSDNLYQTILNGGGY